MALTPQTTILLLLLAPFVAAIVAPWLQHPLRSFSGWVLALVPAAGFVALFETIPSIAAGEAVTVRFGWVPSLALDLVLRIDGLSLLFGLCISGIGALILIYSGAYLRGHPHQGRFNAFLLFFLGAMLGLVLADSLPALFLFWELTSVASFLLIGFDHRRQAARRAAIQALLVTGIGGLALLVGAVVLRFVLDSWVLSDVLGSGEALRASGLLWAALIPLLLAAFTKSAQLPFHFWLPNAMEAPTPVSAFLHSATMVQAGVYLLARVSPLFSGTPEWTLVLTLVGGATLLWASVQALRQTDLKLMLAHSTVGALGFLVFLLGVGTELAVSAAVLFFLAHALYKAALFLCVGIIDHETGTRDLTLLRGLADKLPATFIAAAVAGFSMFGLTASLGFLGKEEAYAALLEGPWELALGLVVLVVGNAVFGAVALTVALRPFLGERLPTPLEPHENSPSLLLGPLVLAVLGIAGGIAVGWVGWSLVGPAAAAVLGHSAEHLPQFGIDPLNPAFALSVLTWLLAVALFARGDSVRAVLRRGGELWTFDRGFDRAMAGLLRMAAGAAGIAQSGRLKAYVVTLAVLLALAAAVPILWLEGLPDAAPPVTLLAPEWALLIFVVAGAGAVLPAPSLLAALLSLGVQGVALTLIFLTFGAPDLALTQLAVEVVSVVMLALVMARLRLHHRAARPWRSVAVDGGVALLGGAAVTLVLLTVLSGDFDARLGEFFNAASLPLAHGRNVVNVILVDFRALDTLGEIAVLVTAGIAIVALIRGVPRRQAQTAPRTAVAAPAEIRWHRPLAAAAIVRWYEPEPAIAAVRWFRPEAPA